MLLRWRVLEIDNLRGLGKVSRVNTVPHIHKLKLLLAFFLGQELWLQLSLWPLERLHQTIVHEAIPTSEFRFDVIRIQAVNRYVRRA